MRMENIDMKRIYIILILTLVTLLCFSSCGEKYSENDFIGLSSLDIVNKFGDFDRKQSIPNDDGLYRNCACGYLVAEAKKGFFGTTPPKYFMIYFDENGIARYCVYEQVV